MPPLVMAFDSGGSCSASGNLVCGEAPQGDTQYVLLSDDCDVDEFFSCLESAGSDVEEILDCISSKAYCTSKIDKAEDIFGYKCFIEAASDCTRSSEEIDLIGSMLSASMPHTMLGKTITKELPGGIMTQAELCTTFQCGTTPNGKEQHFLIDPSDCDDYEDCFQNDPTECAKFLFCAEDYEFDTTLKLTSYECTGDVTVTGTTVELEVCDD
jgi:hypothetical protein